MKNKIPFLLIAIFFLAYVLRVLYLPQGAVSFYYDQARDAFIVDQLLSGDIKVQGPPSSTPGLFHGVFYYYAIAPGYLLGQGSPIAAAYWMAFLNTLAVFVVFYLTLRLTKDKLAAYISAFLFAISFEASQYATWLSNPTLAVLTLPLGYLGLWLWLKEKDKWGPYIAALGFGLSIQAEVFLAYHAIPFALWLFVKRKEIKRHDFVTFLAVLFVSLSSMLVAQLKFGAGTLGGVANLLTAQDVVLRSKSLGDFIILYLNQLGNTFSNAVFPSNPGWGGAFVLILLIISLKTWMERGKKDPVDWEPFIASYILAHLPVVSFGGVSTPFLTVGIGVAAAMLVGIVLSRFWKKNKFVVLAVLVILSLSNLSAILTKNKDGQTALVIQKDLILKNELKAIDYTYQEAAGEDFTINTTTNPLWVNTTWSYLYNWYGVNKYGYLPHWTGRDQVGRFGNNLPASEEISTIHFYIIEPPEVIPGKFLEDAFAAEQARSEIVEVKKFGDIEVQKRIPLED